MTTLILTVNVHGLSREAATTPEDALFGKFAHGRYAYSSGLLRLLRFLDEQGVKATFFWPLAEIARAPALFEACLAAGHEIGAHGVAFEELMKLGRSEEEELLGRMTDELKARIGAPPKGYRSPTGGLSLNTIPILAGLGYGYDASFVDDDAPYALDADGGPGMVELPWFEGLSDAHYFGRRMTQDRAELFLNEELDALLPVAGYGTLTLHPRSDIGSARAARLVMIGRLLARAREKHSAGFATCAEAATAFRA
jgi:peptidoglycan/xylan/chitin deacetylase (PgdA/CDA1 family)